MLLTSWTYLKNYNYQDIAFTSPSNNVKVQRLESSLKKMFSLEDK